MASNLPELVSEIVSNFSHDCAQALKSGRLTDLERVKGQYLGKGGRLSQLMRNLASMEEAEQRMAGRHLNAAKATMENNFKEVLEDLAVQLREETLRRERIDVTLPGRFPEPGSLHPITKTRLRIEQIFREMGYSVESGPEIESDFNNFTALNMPPDHPARDSQDTFYIEGGWVLRTHTSPVQVRCMLRDRPPIKLIAPGPVYRRDYDLTHLPMFHQVEGLVVDRGIRFSDLKGTLERFCRLLFGTSVRVRLSPSYFPFVEPGAEVNISCTVCGGSGCRTCKSSGWLEILGAGMVHPAVFRAVGYDPEEYTGFAFGGGIDRITMLLHGIDDLRLLLENDLRFLRQFQD